MKRNELKRRKARILSTGDACTGVKIKVKTMGRKEKLDPEVEALIQWCIAVEGFLVAGGATVEQAQQHIEEEVEWFTDLFYEGLSPEEAAKEALA